MIVLHIDPSPKGAGSVSRDLSRQIIDRLRARAPDLEIIRYDLGDQPVAHLTADAIGALRRAEATTDEQREVGARSDRMIEELQRADLIVIGSPMYNFGITSQHKAWFDNVVHAGKTFRYTDQGPQGLLHGKRAIVVESRGGIYSSGPFATFDHQEPHLKSLLGFVGITAVQFIRAEGLDTGPESRAHGVAQARNAVMQIFAGVSSTDGRLLKTA